MTVTERSLKGQLSSAVLDSIDTQREIDDCQRNIDRLRQRKAEHEERIARLREELRKLKAAE
jgi:hypothetical protein